jgi:hypothetical protein
LQRIAEVLKGTLIISATNVRRIRRCLHPETATDPAAQKRRLTEASQIFSGLPMHVVEMD